MEAIKSELIDRINKMTDENIVETKHQIDKLFEFTELAKSIWKTVPKFIIPNNETVSAQIEDNQKMKIEVQMKDNSSEPKKASTILNEPLPLERRLRGGVLKREGTTLYVPEKLIRTNGWTHGDYLIAIGENEQDLLYEKVSDSVTADRSNRVELDYCLISETEEGKLIVKQQFINGVLKPSTHNNVEQEFIIETVNAANFKLQNGDIVTIAFYANRPHEFKIIWVYTDIPEYNLPLVPAPKPSSFYKESSVEKKVQWNEAERKLLTGKKLVIIGADFRANDFITLATEVGISCRVLSGDESDARFEAAVRGNDLIVTLSSHSSHRSSELAKTLAKKYEIPFRAAPTSLSSVKRAIIHGISAKEIMFHSLF